MCPQVDHQTTTPSAKVFLQLQGCKVLLLGDHRAFFTMYRVIVDAGLRAHQLDRDGALSKAGLQVS
jgi:hypothetical protein